MDSHGNDNNNLEPMPESYEAPEVFELGDAALLTLGNYGCRDDGKSCTFSSGKVDF